MKKSKKRTKKNKPSPRSRMRAVIRNMLHHKGNIKSELKEQFVNEMKSLMNDFFEGNISPRQLEGKANDLIKKYPRKQSKSLRVSKKSGRTATSSFV